MSDEMEKIRKQNKAKQEELAKTYPLQIILVCETQDCENTVTFKDKSEMENALKEGKPYCAECIAKRLETDGAA